MNALTEFKEGLLISWDAIRANKMRSVLTTLGIVIGILTVTLMGTAIEGLNRAFVKSISFIGADVLYVQRFNWMMHSHEEWLKAQKRRPITLVQANELERQLTQARAVAPTAQSWQKIQYKKRRSNNVTIIGTTEQFMTTAGVSISEGRFMSPSEAQGARPVCVVGYQVATNLFESESAVGKKILIGGATFEVVGVLEKQGSFLDTSLDNQAVVPLGQFVASFWNFPDYEVQVKVKQLEELEDAKEELRVIMRRIRHLSPSQPDDFAINQQDLVVRMFHRVAGTIAAIGLFPRLACRAHESGGRFAKRIA